MRGEKGKLVCIWSPVLHGEGCSTLACSLGFGLQYYTGKRVLIANISNSTSHMEKYVEQDIKIKYSMDNLKVFNTGIKAEHILTYATEVNTSLYMIAGSRLDKRITREDTGFYRLFIDRCMESFDLVIADMDTGVRKENALFLDLADSIAAVLTPNEIIIDELYQEPEMREALAYFTERKTIPVINKLYGEWDSGRVLAGYKAKYKLENVFGLDYDGDILNACCTDKNFYSFLMKEIKREKNIYAEQLTEICEFMVEKLYMEKKAAEEIKYRNLFKRILRSSAF